MPHHVGERGLRARLTGYRAMTRATKNHRHFVTTEQPAGARQVKSFLAKFPTSKFRPNLRRYARGFARDGRARHNLRD